MEKITEKMVQDHGLTQEEYASIRNVLGREPNFVELGIFSVMWSEHCSYKSSKKWLNLLPVAAPWVICGPGENAGIVDIGDSQAIVFKMESHNHPSFIAPYHGAATGLGGIMRDIFTMGARPIANLNALRFGDISHEKTRHFVAGVVSGIGDYGNCVGVPNIGGEINFHKSYNGNILVNGMTIGLVTQDKIFYSAASGVGNSVVYLGARTGREGIHGATMASEEFAGAEETENRSTVQVGDPFKEKLLLEACLNLMEEECIIAIQDMGAAGLTSSIFEMAEKGEVGINLHLESIPLREENMTPYEIMLSESQERMLIILKKGTEEKAFKIFQKWNLDFALIGDLNETKNITIYMHGEMIVDLPVDCVVKGMPQCNRPWVSPRVEEPLKGDFPTKSWKEDLICLMGSPDLASRRWVYEQYDSSVRGNTVLEPGENAGIVRIEGTRKGIVASVDCTPRYVYADPFEGAKQAVAETWRNITAVGGKPLAITDNMNFGNPQRPEIMGQFIRVCQGMTEACLALEYPVVSGNVSLYNETQGKAIYPTPVIGGVGIVSDIQYVATASFKREGDAILLVGMNEENRGWLGSSLYLREIYGLEKGAPPPVDLEKEKRHGDFVRQLIMNDQVDTCHDVSDGGLLVALAEMALAGNIGFELTIVERSLSGYLFGEDQGRYVLSYDKTQLQDLVVYACEQGVDLFYIGHTVGKDIVIGGEKLSLSDLRRVHEGWFPNYMKGVS